MLQAKQPLDTFLNPQSVAMIGVSPQILRKTEAGGVALNVTDERGGGAALVDVLTKFSALCEELRDDASEIDINPLMVLDEGMGAKAVDCLIVPRWR